VSLDRLGGMDSDQDPELARMLSQVAQLSEADRAAIKRVLEAFTAQNAKK
jgi:hypothetical protein